MDDNKNDMEIVCRDCKNAFVFTVKDQYFFEEKFGATYNKPTRCLPCRKVRREQNTRSGEAPSPNNLRPQTHGGFEPLDNGYGHSDARGKPSHRREKGNKRRRDDYQW